MKKILFFALMLLSTTTFAHKSHTFGEGENAFTIAVGMTREPVVTDSLNGLDLIVFRNVDGERVFLENLEGSLQAEITSPDGSSTHMFSVRPQYNQPGYYTDDIILTEAGVYTIRVYGFVDDMELDHTFETHEVRAYASLAFP